MAKTEFLEYLFYSHLADLRNVDPEIGEVFICPICLRMFSLADIHNGDLSVGHVWPVYIREKSGSEVAAQQRVLLCKRCNSLTGSHGDKQMQLLERVREGEETGELYEERFVRIYEKLGKEPIELRAKVRMQRQDAITGQITFEADRSTMQWVRNNPEEQRRFLALAERGESFSMMIHSHHELKPGLARVGWVTSAYLLAFYTFGYAYILRLQEILTPVRQYLLGSFKDSSRKGPELPESDILGAQLCDTCYYEDPEISVVIPVDGKTHANLRASFLNYHVDLPFRCVYSLLRQKLYSENPDIEDRIPEMIEKAMAFYIPVSCNKANPHDCIWDYILGKPVPVP